jgi:O-antigen ligase
LFYLGYFALQRGAPIWPIWTGISLALCWVIHAGLQQHVGGLEAMRVMFSSGHNPLDVPPDMLKNPDFAKRLASNRIYSTFVYANALAGALVLMLPLTLVFMWRLTAKVRPATRLTLVALLGGAGLACLYWSGSKAGWLVALMIGLVALGHSAMPLKWKRALICGVLVLGVAGFAVKYASYFHRERNSIGARFAYWRAALIVVRAHPWLGTGPGTFQIPYRQLKQLDDEPTKLCHNDYLEQATDSGIPGFVVYSAMIVAILSLLYRYSAGEKTGSWMAFSVWLGVLGLCMHSLVEFHLYIPALAWTAFFLMGWLASRWD